MISICIPVYNCRVGKLVRELSAQIRASAIKAEIILIDDRSADKYRDYNRSACRDHKYILLEKNIGRSRIRNLFLEYADSGYLLFLDCDSVITSDSFLLNYLNEIRQGGSPVICGGLTNEQSVPRRTERLRWKYGVKREEIPASTRDRDPYSYFRTNNFLTDRSILDRIRFDERIAGYGYEDTLFAYRLMNFGIAIKHIDNPVLHCCRETNSSFIEKSENGVANLLDILDYIGHDEAFVKKIRLLQTNARLRKWHLRGLIAFLLMAVKPGLKTLLAGGYAGLWLLDIYKLGILLEKDPEKKNGRQ